MHSALLTDFYQLTMLQATGSREMSESLPSIESKVAALSRPAAYPGNPETVEVIETHMSWVFLAGSMAYKLKKPVRYGRLDFRTVQARRFYCMEELRLNRRLADSVYLDVVPLKVSSVGAIRIDATGRVVDWLVMMHRLPRHLMLDRMLEDGTAGVEDLRGVAARLAAFYRSLPPAQVGRSQYLDSLAGEIDECERELCDPAFDLEADLVHSLCSRLRSVLNDRAHLFSTRVAAGRIVEGHGDLRPEHIYLGTPPAIIDRLEFSADLRTLDTVDELGFLALECERLGSPQLGTVLLDTYRGLTGDAAGEPLIHFYQSLRACTRAKITIWHLREARYRDCAKWPARARQYLGLAARHMQSCESALLPQAQGPVDNPSLPAGA
jgi:aminoglycoside phosphotransferase family enzyme